MQKARVDQLASRRILHSAQDDGDGGRGANGGLGWAGHSNDARDQWGTMSEFATDVGGWRDFFMLSGTASAMQIGLAIGAGRDRADIRLIIPTRNAWRMLIDSGKYGA